MGRGKTAHAKAPTQTAPQAGAGLPLDHRLAFLQVLVARAWLPDSEARQLFNELDVLSGGGASYLGTIADINGELNFLLLAVRQIKYPVDGKRYLAFVNKDNDAIAKENGTYFSISQVQYLRALVEAIATDLEAERGIGTISGIDAMNVNFSESFTQASQSSQATSKSLTMNEKEAALGRFVKDGWLSAAPGVTGHYTLGVRTFAELHQQLMEFDLPDETRLAWEQML